jgi:hypothetical protein
MKRRSIIITILSCLLSLSAAVECRAQQFDISSGGTPTITGASGGTVTGTLDVTQNLAVTINFGELSPINSNNIVKVVVPVAIRSTAAYQVSASIFGAVNADPQAIQRSDVGFGVMNVTRMGNRAQNCSNNTVQSPFNNDPSLTVATGASGRATYPSSLGQIGSGTVILSGPRLTISNSSLSRRDDNGYTFNAIFAVKPQFYSTGTYTATIFFSISAGPSVGCV